MIPYTVMRIEKYEIYLKLEPENTTFLGRETIYIDNNDNRKVLSLDFMDLEIDVLEVDKIKQKISLNHINKTLDVLIPNGKSEIYIEYKGKISNLLVGLYRVKHDNGVMLSTQFESVGARRVFPSIDNPEFKSIFQLFLDVKKPYDAISNSKILSIKEKQHSRIFIFNDTPLM